MIANAVVKFYTHSNQEYTIPCHRHGDAFYIISQFVEHQEIDKKRTWQGFETHNGQFLNREEAMQDAIQCGQLPPGADAHGKELYSEDLW